MYDKLIEAEVKRYKDILGYQNKMSIDEVSYRFYREDSINEQPEEGQDELGTDFSDGGNEAEAQTSGDESGSLEGLPDLGGVEAPEESGAEGGDEGAEVDDAAMMPSEEEEVTEIDVTDLVKGNEEIKQKMDSITTNLGNINQLMSKVKDIENKLSGMNTIVNKMGELAKQVELMRPPTEDERRKALAKDSYPYSVTMDDYKSGFGARTQTDLENSSKTNMFDEIMKDYNEMDVKNSFNIPTENPFERL